MYFRISKLPYTLTLPQPVAVPSASQLCGRDQFACDSGQCVDASTRCYDSGIPRDGCADGSHLKYCRKSSIVSITVCSKTHNAFPRTKRPPKPNVHSTLSCSASSQSLLDDLQGFGLKLQFLKAINFMYTKIHLFNEN